MSVLAQDFLYQDVSRNTIFLDNHDMSRMLSMVGEDINKYKSAMAMLMTMRGVPQLYYGDEILMKNFIRTRMVWYVRIFPGDGPAIKE